MGPETAVYPNSGGLIFLWVLTVFDLLLISVQALFKHLLFFVVPVLVVRLLLRLALIMLHANRHLFGREEVELVFGALQNLPGGFGQRGGERGESDLVRVEHYL